MDPNTPLWALSAAAATGALVGAGYAIVKLFTHIADKRLEYRKKFKEVEDAEVDKDRRSAANEAWEVVDRLTGELEKVAPKVEELRQRCDSIKEECEQREREAVERATRCEADHEGTKRVLQVVVTWGESNGLKLPKELRAEITRERQARPSGSDVHRRLPDGGR